MGESPNHTEDSEWRTVQGRAHESGDLKGADLAGGIGAPALLSV